MTGSGAGGETVVPTRGEHAAFSSATVADEIGSVVPNEPSPTGEGVNGRYAWYVLGVLFLVYAFNAADRSILSILAEDIKNEFRLSDTQLGFLQGTAFAVFYGLFGYPVGRLVDRWSRVKLLSAGLLLWSAMTAIGGLATSFAQLAFARTGVAIGEASASPAGFSLLSDWFTKTKRGTALGIFVSGLHIGFGLSLVVGGLLLHSWTLRYGAHGPFGLAGWQVTLLVVGLPGIALAAWTMTLREAPRGQADGIDTGPPPTGIWRNFAVDVASVLPPFTFILALRAGRRPATINAIVAAVAFAATWLLIRLTGDVMQWLAIGIGYYAAFSAAQSLKQRDPATFRLTWGTRAFVLATIGFGCVSMINVTVGFWAAPLAMRHFPVDKALVGLVLGIDTAIFGIGGIILGGRLSDILVRRHPAGRIWMGIASAVLSAPLLLGLCLARDPVPFYIFHAALVMTSNIWIGAGGAAIQDLVLPRMRGTATTNYFIVSTLIGSGLGPYLVGKISTLQGSLATGMLAVLVVVPCSVLALWWCARLISDAEASKLERARAAER